MYEAYCELVLMDGETIANTALVTEAKVLLLRSKIVALIGKVCFAFGIKSFLLLLYFVIASSYFPSRQSYQDLL